MKNKYFYSLIVLISLSTIYNAQVGINTTNPQSVFHVDGARDNPITGAPTANQQANDFIVTATGNVGIGTTTPTRKLEIISSSSPALRIVDGTQQPNYVLMSDVDGNGSWKSLTNAINAVLPASGYNGSVSNSNVWSGISLTLPSGKWLVLTNVMLKAVTDPSGGNGAWVRLQWSKNQNTADTSGITGALNSGVFLAKYGLATGASIINNINNGNTTYYLNLSGTEIFGNYASNWDNLGSSSWGENSIIAYPAN